MLRIFSLTLTTVKQNLWDLIVATGEIDTTGTILSGGNRTNEILADRGCNLDISSNAANGSVTVTISDRKGNSFNAFLPNTNYNKTTNRNAICYKDYYLSCSVNGAIANVAMESI